MRMRQESARLLFEQARVARLATVGSAGEPHLVPVTFAVIGTAESDSAGMIVFAVDHKPKSTTALRRLENIAANPRVAFLVDSYQEDWEQLWWVRADADAAVLTGAVRESALAALTAKYVQYQQVPPKAVVIGAEVTAWSGWRFADPDPPAD
jgi:PPOX class probable F420-dependent enzyme